MPTNGKRRFMMTSGFRQHILEFTVANFSCYPIRRRVTYAHALEFIFWAICKPMYINANPILSLCKVTHSAAHFMNLSTEWRQFSYDWPVASPERFICVKVCWEYVSPLMVRSFLGLLLCSAENKLCFNKMCLLIAVHLHVQVMTNSIFIVWC